MSKKLDHTNKVVPFKTMEQMAKAEMIATVMELFADDQIGEVMMIMRYADGDVGFYTSLEDRVQMMGMIELAKFNL